MKSYALLMIAACLLFAGCNRGDFKATIVMAEQPAPHSGYNIGPDIWVEQGQPCIVSGAVVWAKGLDPNDIVGN